MDFFKGGGKGALVIPFIISLIKDASSDRKMEQKAKMMNFVDRLCSKMKDEFAKQEPAITKTIAQSLR